ncbi:hypothetical protein DFH11DRAFT_1728734 [Phellopilus nigrolimitatus]|nr:hypothetical protein DFH11DRAFT_1728734 [Phellopilus nigrolimitatus]
MAKGATKRPRVTMRAGSMAILRAPTLAPDLSTVQPAYNYSQELRGPAVRAHTRTTTMSSRQADTLSTRSWYNPHASPRPYPSELLQRSAYYGDGSHAVGAEEDRPSKRRRVSIDSASEPPSSTALYSSYATETSRSSFDMGAAYAYPSFALGSVHGGSDGNGTGTLRACAFWHPPMLPQMVDKSLAALVHPQTKNKL